MQNLTGASIDFSAAKCCLWTFNSALATSAPWEQREQGRRAPFKILTKTFLPPNHKEQGRKKCKLHKLTVELQSCSESATGASDFIQRRIFFFSVRGENTQVAQRGSECPIPGNTQGQVGFWATNSLKVPFNPNHFIIVWFYDLGSL